jgi:hypothetical protein
LSVPDEGYSTKFDIYVLICTLYFQGRLLYLDIIDGPMMVMEIKWLSNLLSGLKPIENDGKFPCVSETTEVMSISESEQIVTQQKLGSASTTHVIMSPPTHTPPPSM